MGFFDEPFGGLFDLDNDGKTDFLEEALAYHIFNECMKEEKDEYDSSLLSDDLDFQDDDLF